MMTEKIPSMSSMPKEAKKTTSRSEGERAAVRELVKAARARGEDLTGPDGLLKSITATYVRIDTSDYSVHPAAIGARVDVAADLDVVRVRHGGRLVAEHPRRWARSMTVTDPAHVAAAADLRRAYQHRDTVLPDEHEGLVRDLADYDRAFGLDTGAGGSL